MAAIANPAKSLVNLERELMCSICTEILYQPLTLLDCLHTFCGSCLKEWFVHQHRKASSSRSSSSTSAPYTCPTCRATVKDAQHNAMVNTLLDVFLSDNPKRGRSEEDKAEMRQVYKPGDNILPKVERRRERRARREEEELAARERRMVEEARERSLRDVQAPQAPRHDRLAPPHSERRRSSSHEREDRRERRRHRDRDHPAQDVTVPLAHVQTDLQQSLGADQRSSTLSPPATSPRHPDAVEARQRERRMAHQASLRSLVSASEAGTGSSDSYDEARIMQEILAEGLLDGIDVESLTEAEQDMWAERIAEAYRQRHPRRSTTSSPPMESPPSDPRDSQSLLVESDRLQPNDGTDRRRRSSSRRAETTPSPNRRSTSREGLRPVRTMPVPTVGALPTNSSVTIRHRRHDSDHGRVQDASQSRSRRSSPNHSPPMSRSATDIASEVQDGEAAPDARPHRLSINNRSTTEPNSPPRASEVWRQAGGDDRRLQSNAAASQAPRTAPTTPRSVNSQVAAPDSNSERVVVPQPSSSGLQALAHFEEPSLDCARCFRTNIQYEIYKHCYKCNLDLCMSCYRQAKGCNHWYGFGHAALINFEASKTTNESTELPHFLTGRQYAKPETGTVLQSKTLSGANESIPTRTTSDPAQRLREGYFCDRCGSFANSQFWMCDYCNEGEWGFCKECLDTHHCCNHPLQAIAFSPYTQPTNVQSTLTETSTVNPTASELPTNTLQPSPGHSRPASIRSFASTYAAMRGTYVDLNVTTSCDLCSQAIPPAHLRFHCPFHPSPSPSNPDSHGDYDICTLCYHNFVKAGKMRREDGPVGWRKCPKGHRMIIVSFEEDDDAIWRRIVKHDLVGGWKMTEKHIAAWTSIRSPQATSAALASTLSNPNQSSPSSGLTRGTWTWSEDGTTSRRTTRSRASTFNQNQQISQSASAINGHHKFPPDGGFGMRAVAQWSYYPASGNDGQGELMFPRGAEIGEIEDVNSDWWAGVYAGDIGVLPSGHVMKI